MKELVIKIDDDAYRRTCEWGTIIGCDTIAIASVISQGKVLPKGHKELIDTKGLIQSFVKAEESMKDNGVTPVLDVHEITNMILSQEVIVEADKEE